MMVPSNQAEIDAKATQAMIAHFARNKGPDLKHPDYGLSVTISIADITSIDIVLTFKRGARYCCAEPGCHLGASRPQFWTELRKHFLDVGLSLGFPVVLHIKGVVEEGALLDLGHTSVPTAQKGYEYEDMYREDDPRPEPILEPEPPPGYTGVWTDYDPEGRKTRESVYVNGHVEGRVTSFAANGQRTREGCMLNGRWHGTMRQWRDGKLIDESEWVNGTGIHRIYYCSGKLAVEQHLREGKRHGVLKKWNGEGELTVTAYYEDGKLVRHEGIGDPR